MTSATALTNNTWIAIADGTGARLYAANSDGESLSLSETKELSPTDPLEHGPSGSRPPEQTEQQKDEAAFAHQLADRLYLAAHAGKFDQLVVIADPQTLGQLRGIFHQEVIDRIAAEFPKTLTNLPHQDLEVAVTNLLS